MKPIQIRNVPDELHRSLKARAARQGTTMSQFLLAELHRLASRPSPEHVLARIRRRTPVSGSPAADLIRAERG